MKLLAFIVLGLWSALVLAQGGAIPTQYMNDPAIDLTRNGQPLMPDEVHALRESTNGRFDISTLNPVETSDLWTNFFPKYMKEDSTPIHDMDEVNYHSPVLSTSGIFRFNIENKSGNGRLYTMMLSKNVHSVLLAKGLLHKLGYTIPDIKYLPRIIIKFKSELEKKTFISYLENVAFAGAAKSWVVEELEDNKILVQDLIVMDSNNAIYNLAVGVTSDMVQGRRLLSSLAVPLSIVNLTESVNMFRWNAGVISNKQVVLFHDQLDQFQCSWDDARWITRRIEKLSREDWSQIVDESNLPKSVQIILLEKIISRRNSVMKLFSIDAREMKMEDEPSSGVELVKGKLTQQNWPGYASRFAYGDPESPLSSSEVKSWVKSKALSTLLDVVVSQINQLPYIGTDISKVNNQEFQDNLASAVATSVANKTPAEIPLKAWIFPTIRGQIILSRNLITGTYMGTDNLVQLVDTVGVAVGAGAFVGTMGLPTPIQVFASGEALYVRSYAHLRPVTSIQKSLKYPFKNILVPLVKHDYGKKLHEAAQLTVDPEASEETRAAAFEKAIRPFKDAMEVGESIIVTDSLATYIGAQIAAGYNKLFRASLGLVPGHMVVSRFHVHRKSTDEFQIYKDLGQVGSISGNLNIDTLIPVLKLSYKKSKGTAKVKFFTLNLNPKNPDAIKNASLLRRAIVSSSTEDIEEDETRKPYIIKHSFKESNPSINLFFWQWQWQKAFTNISVTNPKGDTRWFRRFYKGKTSGRNYQAYITATINHWVNLLFDFKGGLADTTNTNPGYSVKGVADTKVSSFDEEVDSQGKMIEPFVRLSRIKNGWAINKKAANVILSNMRTRYRHDFWNAPVLNDTQRIFLYNISLNMLFYRDGIDFLFKLKEDEIKRIYRTHKSFENLVINPAKIEDKDTDVRTFLKYMAKFRKYESRNDEEDANSYLLKAFSHAEENLTVAGMSALMGGDSNFYMSAKIEGFREGDEDGDKALISSSLGEFGSANLMGPIVQVQRGSEMLEGEFFIYWMMTRLI
ncbi:MAG TPA: hypothetical protein VNJ08_08440 [Bacteriovoracaceae bacterium]|nr:hypothetical protein [Bacteriovoracaceae bacterium]